MPFVADRAAVAQQVLQVHLVAFHRLGVRLGRPLERSKRFGDEHGRAQGQFQPLGPFKTRQGLVELFDRLGQMGDALDIFDRLGRQAEHEIELGAAPATTQGQFHRLEEILLGDVLVDDIA